MFLILRRRAGESVGNTDLRELTLIEFVFLQEENVVSLMLVQRVNAAAAAVEDPRSDVVGHHRQAGDGVRSVRLRKRLTTDGTEATDLDGRGIRWA